MANEGGEHLGLLLPPVGCDIGFVEQLGEDAGDIIVDVPRARAGQQEHQVRLFQPPALGADTAEVLASIGYTAEEIASLRKGRAI